MIELVDPRGVMEHAGRRLAARAGKAGASTRIGFLSNEQEHLTDLATALGIDAPDVGIAD